MVNLENNEGTHMNTTLDTTLYGAPIDECERCESPWPLGDGLYAGLCHDCARAMHTNPTRPTNSWHE